MHTPKQLGVSNRGYSMVKNIKAALAERLDEKLQSGEVISLLPLNEHIAQDATQADFANMAQTEHDLVLKLKTAGRQMGSDEGEYEGGILLLTFTNKQAVIDYANWLDTVDEVYDYEIAAYNEEIVHGFVNDEEVPLDNILFDKNFEFEITVEIDPSLVLLAPVEIELTAGDDEYAEFDDENGYLTEVRRRIKVNFKGKRRVKMQCRAGFKWDSTKRTCLKITGAEQAKKRKELRKAVRTKKAKGESFKVRVKRKTKKAMKFRKALGINKAQVQK